MTLRENIIDLYISGKSGHWISKNLQISKQRVYRVLENANVERKFRKHDNNIRELYNQGFKNSEIASKLDIHYTTVARFLSREKLNPNHKPVIINDLYAICSTCKETKELKRFTSYRKCYDCTYKRNKFIRNNKLENNLRYRLNNKRADCKRRNIKFGLTLEHLIELYHKQKGKCFYTNIEMITDVGLQNNSLSIDRIIPSKGYIIENIVLCISKINTAKSSLSMLELKKYMPPLYRKIIKKFPELKC